MGDWAIRKMASEASKQTVDALRIEAPIVTPPKVQPTLSAPAATPAPSTKDTNQTQARPADGFMTECVKYDLDAPPPGLFVSDPGDKNVYDERGKPIPGLRARRDKDDTISVTDLRGKTLTNEQIDAAFKKFRGFYPADHETTGHYPNGRIATPRVPGER